MLLTFRQAWAFLTRLPGGSHPTSNHELGRSVPWFPVVGTILGAFGGFLYWVLSSSLGSSLAATAAITAVVLTTGALHEDGLTDTADALGGANLESRLTIMKDSRVGTFGVLALILSVLGRIFALSSLEPRDGLFALIVTHALSRAAAIAVMITSPTASSSTGLGNDYSEYSPTKTSAAVVVFVGASAIALGPAGAIALAATAVCTIIVAVTAKRKFGTITGDNLGAIEQVGEIAVLVSIVSLVTHHGWSWL